MILASESHNCKEIAADEKKAEASERKLIADCSSQKEKDLCSNSTTKNSLGVNSTLRPDHQQQKPISRSQRRKRQREAAKARKKLNGTNSDPLGSEAQDKALCDRYGFDFLTTIGTLTIGFNGNLTCWLCTKNKHPVFIGNISESTVDRMVKAHGIEEEATCKSVRQAAIACGVAVQHVGSAS